MESTFKLLTKKILEYNKSEGMFKETKLADESIKVEIEDNGKTKLIGYYSPNKHILITSKRELAEYLILKKNYKLFSVLTGEKISKKPRFYFVLINVQIS